jgi:uroporphyrinogen decarboxylase
VPLLGFCGAPFTVASYLIGDLPKTVAWMRQDPSTFTKLLESILQATIWYLQMQERRGVDAVQIFDSWANVLTPEEHALYCIPFIEKLASAVNVPSLFFMRDVGPYISKVPCGVSVDWTLSMQEARGQTTKPLQGNLDPKLLFEPLSIIEKKTQEILLQMQGDPGFILNLGHGILPNTPLEAVCCFVDTAKNFRGDFVLASKSH